MNYRFDYEQLQETPREETNMQILENILQSRKSLELQKVNAIIAAQNDKNAQNEIIRSGQKYNDLRSSLDYQMNEILKDLGDKSNNNNQTPLSNNPKLLNVTNQRQQQTLEDLQNGNIFQQQQPKMPYTKKETLLRQSHDFLNKSLNSNSVKFESEISQSDEENEDESHPTTMLKLNLKPNQTPISLKSKNKEAVNTSTTPNSRQSAVVQFQKKYRDLESRALRKQVQQNNTTDEGEDKVTCMDRFRAGVKEFFSCAVPVDENEIVDENHKPELNYSVGEDESEFDVPYSLLTKDEKTERMEYLWYRCYLKANGAAKIYHRFAEVHRNILIFGTTKNINYDPTKADREAFLNKKPWILLPESQFKKFWNFVIIFLLMYTASFVPVKTAFFDDDPPGLFEFELFLDSLFIIDLFVNFLSAYEDPMTGFIEVRAIKIARNYITSWFLLDVTACIPFQLLSSEDSSGSSVRLLRLARLPRLYRLLRILRLFKMFSLFKHNQSFKKYLDALKMNTGIMRMVQVTGGVFFMVHLMACFWFLSAKFNDFEYDCWVMQRGIEDYDDGYQYLTSVYWALQTITTVGYGDIPAKTMAEQILSILWMVFGVGFYSFTIGNLSSVIASMDTKNSILKQKLQTLADFSKRIELPQQLEHRIKRFLENNNKDATSLDDQERLLNELPPSLKSEVVSHTHGNIISGIKFFQDKNPDFLWQILPLLKNMKIYRGDILYSQGDHADEIYFILKGSVVMHIDLNDPLINPDYQPKEKVGDSENQEDDAYNVPFNLYVEGSYFGDSDCLYQRKQLIRECMAEAELECHLLVVKKQNLEELLDQFQDIKTQMINIAQEKRKYHKRLIQELLRKHKQNLVQELESPAIRDKKETSVDITRYKSLKRRKTFKGRPGSSMSKDNFLSSQENSDNDENNKDEFGSFKKGKTPDVQIPIITYSEGMKNVINQFTDNKNPGGKNTNGGNTGSNSNRQDQQTSYQENKQQKLDEQLQKLEREAKKLEILNDSENYYEKNLNAFNNNMSLLALNTYEISQLMTNLNRDNQQILSIAKNITAHTNFIAKKSEDLKRKVMLVAEKLNKHSQ